MMSTRYKVLPRFALTLILAAVCVITVGASAARAAMAGLISPAILGGLNQTVTSGGSTGYTAGARLGVGIAILEADVSAMYLSRSFSGIAAINGGSDSIRYVQIPVMLRYSFVPMLSVGAGGYYDIAITSDASAVYGVRGALMVNVPGIPIFAEANYSYNLGSGSSGTVNDFQFLVGFKL